MCKFLCGAAQLYRTSNCNIIRKSLCEINYKVSESYVLIKSQSYAQAANTAQAMQNLAPQYLSIRLNNDLYTLKLLCKEKIKRFIFDKIMTTLREFCVIL